MIYFENLCMEMIERILTEKWYTYIQEENFEVRR
jgi:hypothetical protein